MLVQTPSLHQERSTSKGLSRLFFNVWLLPQHESVQRENLQLLASWFIAATLYKNMNHFPFLRAPLYVCMGGVLL
jgi:hypothetical protein